jgi:hypothetical protein
MNRIDALLQQAPRFNQPLAGLSESDFGVTPEGRRTGELVKFEIHPPIAGAGRLHEQIEAVAVRKLVSFFLWAGSIDRRGRETGFREPPAIVSGFPSAQENCRFTYGANFD